MQISDKIKIEELFLILEDEKALILGDIHLGYEETLNKQGILIPRCQYPLIIEKLKKFLEAISFEKIIINGDLKHEFGSISETEWRHILKLIDYLATKCNELMLIRGNHDKILGPIAKKRNIKVVENLILNDVLITHGDRIPHEISYEKINKIIIGHEHPAISVCDASRVEKFKCFLHGKWKNKELIVIPSFNPIQEGTDLLRENTLSPFLKSIENFNVYIIGDEIMDFGKLSQLKKLMRP